MMSKHKNYLLTLFCLTAVFAAFCQQPAKDVETSLNTFMMNAVGEKIFTHTDKNFYLAGDIIWFKLYVVNANDNKPMDVSKVAYVEIIDRSQAPVLQCKIALNNGAGSGSLYLPSALNSGIYQFRAYTSWMKNFDADYYFHRQITIVNTLKNFSAQPNPLGSYDAQFFPEGGNLVMGIQSKVAFRIVDQSGKGVEGKGVVVDDNGGIVAEFQPLKFGIGNFNFKPVPGRTYRAIIKMADTTITRVMPLPMEHGYVLSLEQQAGSQLHITISSNVSSAKSAYVFIHSRGMEKIGEKIALTNGNAELDIDASRLGEGVSHITVLNGDGLPQCERLLFIPPTQKLVILPSLDKQQFTSRKKVQIMVSSTDELKKPGIADLSVSIYRVDSLQLTQEESIDNYFWLTSELRGNIESPGYYFSQRTAEVNEAIDNLMLTHGWRRFTGQSVMQGTSPVYHFLPEYKGHIINGKVINAKTGRPAANVVAYVSVPGSRVQLYTARSDSAGSVRFYTKDFYGPNEIALQAESSGDTTYKLQVVSPFSQSFSSESLPALVLPKNMKPLLSDYSVGAQVQNIYSGENLRHFFAPAIDTNSFFGKPDVQYLLDNYTRFTTMEEVLREYVYEVLVRRQKENFRFIVTDGDNKIFLDDPLTLVNGVPVFDPNKIIKYDPLNVEKIEVVKRKYFYGPAVFNGIVNFITYHPDPSALSDLGPIIEEYEGLQYQREFFSPVYETEEQISSRLPDFRNVLYWSPNVQTDAQGKAEINFFTSDLKGKYIAIIQGINSDGRLGENSILFEVK